MTWVGSGTMTPGGALRGPPVLVWVGLIPDRLRASRAVHPTPLLPSPARLAPRRAERSTPRSGGQCASRRSRGSPARPPRRPLARPRPRAFPCQWRLRPLPRWAWGPGRGTAKACSLLGARTWIPSATEVSLRLDSNIRGASAGLTPRSTETFSSAPIDVATWHSQTGSAGSAFAPDAGQNVVAAEPLAATASPGPLDAGVPLRSEGSVRPHGVPSPWPVPSLASGTAMAGRRGCAWLWAPLGPDGSRTFVGLAASAPPSVGLAVLPCRTVAPLAFVSPIR
jgi:hypothetical protein